LVVGSATNDASVLAVGSANQVLTVDSSTSTGLKWAAPAGGATFVEVAQSTFSATNQITFDSIFTNTYHAYLVLFEEVKSIYPYNALMKFKWRKAGANIVGNACTSGRVYIQASNSTNWTFDLYSGQNEMILFGTDNRPGNATFWFNPRNLSGNQYPSYHGTVTQGNQVGLPCIVSGSLQDYQTNIDGFQINTVSNLEGTITVYGVTR